MKRTFFKLIFIIMTLFLGIMFVYADGVATLDDDFPGFADFYISNSDYEHINYIRFVDTTKMEYEVPAGTPISIAEDGSTAVDAYILVDNELTAPDNKYVVVLFSGSLHMPEDISNMFNGLLALEKIYGFEYLDTSAVTNMAGLFSGCSALNSVDFSNINTANVTNMSTMFRSTGFVELDLSHFNTAKVTDFSSMFNASESLQRVDVSSFDTNLVTKFNNMFKSCSSLTTLDLKSFDFVGTPQAKSMFQDDESLETIYVKPGTDLNDVPGAYTSMFSGCESLVGQEGTEYDSNHVNGEYGRVDDPTNDKPGYFSSIVSANMFDVIYEVNQVYTGSPINPEVTVKYHGETLVKNTDYTIEITNNVNIGIGTGTITITGIGKYKDTIYKYFDINPRSISSATVDDIPDQTYTGQALTPSVTVRLGSDVLVKDTDYTIEYHNNTNAGEAYVTISGIGEYGGETTAPFNIIAIDINSLTFNNVPVQTYTGSPLTPDVVIKNGNMPLVNNIDYTLDYENNTEVGTATIIVTGIGNYRLTKQVTFKIRTSITNATIDPISSQAYTAKAITPEVVVRFNGAVLVKDTDYTVFYSNNTNVGHGNVIITGAGDFYTGTKETTFEITQGNISGATVNARSQEYTGSAVTTTAEVKFNGVTLVEGTDYTLEFANNVEIGTADVTVKGKGNLTGSKASTFSITQADINKATVEEVETQTYTGSAIKPKVTATFNNMDLVEGTDYTLEYENNIYTGNASVILVGHNRFKGRKSVTFRIKGADIGNATIESVADQTFTGSDITPEVVVKYNDKTLVKDTDYIVEYSNNRNVGNATVTINGKGSFSESKSATFKIVSASISTATIDSIENQLYTGEAITPKPIVRFNKNILTEGTDYTLSYKDNIESGTATVIVTGKNNLSGTKSATFIIKGLDLKNMTIDKVPFQIYTGKELTPKVTIRFKEVILEEGVDYELSYKNNIKEGTATVIATGLNKYDGKISATFKIHYGIKYVLNGGINDLSNHDYYDRSKNTNLYNATKEGYIFKGWYTSSKYKTKITQITKGSTGNKTLYAKFSPIKYTIKFYSNGGKGTTKSMTLKYNKTYNLNKNKFTKKGYKFIGWNTKKDGSGTSYTNKQEVVNLTKKNKKVIKLYAQWEKKTYTLNYELKGGILEKENKSTYTVTTKTFKLNNPKKTGYIFSGWYTNKKYKGSKVTKIVKGSAGNKTLYAKWTPIKYYVIFKQNGGKGFVRDITAKYGKTYTLTKNSYTKKGYKFIGWNTKSDGTGTSYSNKEKIKNLTTKNGKKITLYAQWKKKTYTITYELNGGVNNTENPETYNIKTATITLKKPTREGYKFKGWYSNKKLTKRVKTIDKGSTGNKKLYAKWEKLPEENNSEI